MYNDLSHYRKSYEKGELLLKNTPENPMELFRNWFVEVDTHYQVEETNAMTLSTIGLDGYPKSRVVLLKQYTFEGFIFYTNYLSEKGKAISIHPQVCLSFFWASAERQIIIKGKAETIAENLSDGYFESRPKGSQIGALISPQSQVIPHRKTLEAALLNAEHKYNNIPIERPKHWGGYIVKPTEIEFWQGRANRLHDRIRYQLQQDYNWLKERLAP